MGVSFTTVEKAVNTVFLRYHPRKWRAMWRRILGRRNSEFAASDTITVRSLAHAASPSSAKGFLVADLRLFPELSKFVGVFHPTTAEIRFRV
jgi:hypothetical protein